MRLSNLGSACAFLVVTSAGIFVAGCDTRGNNSRDTDVRVEADKVQQEVAKATEKAKPAIQQAGREIRDAAKDAVAQTQAAARGAKEGWEHGARSKVDLNSATESDLISLPGITHHDARRIISRRPYREPHDLVTKGALTEDNYAKIRDEVTAI